MATSYTNPLSTGDRRKYIDVTCNFTFPGGKDPNLMINGSFANDIFFGGNPAASTIHFDFDFGDAYVIDEAKWYQSVDAAQGVWQWQGSNDGSSYSNIGATFTLGSPATQTITTLNGNTTAYRYYRLQGISGTTNGGPDQRELEFKIEVRPADTTDYANAGGTGDRTSVITATNTSGLFTSGSASLLVNGVIATSGSDLWFGGDVTGKEIRFDFATGKIIDEARLYTRGLGSNLGTWKWQGSGDASSWTDIGSNFTIVTKHADANSPDFLRQLRGNIAGYRYYRMLGVSGVASSVPNLDEMEFRIADTVAPPATVAKFFDNYVSTLASAYVAGATTLVVSSVGSGVCALPEVGDYDLLVECEGSNTFEVFKVSGRSGSTLTVTGAQACTSASNHATGAVIRGAILTAARLAQWRQDLIDEIVELLGP